MSKWKTTQNHWSKQPNSEEVRKRCRISWTQNSNADEIKNKCIKNLKSDYWKGKKRSDETKQKISKTKNGVKVWGGKRKGMHWMNGNQNGFKKGQIPWNKGKEYLAIKGENNVNWKGGVTPINEKIRRSIEYKLWRESVFKRDNYTCIWCGQIGDKLNADHIKSFALYPELRFAIDNGRTLCADCHKKTNNFGNKNYG